MNQVEFKVTWFYLIFFYIDTSQKILLKKLEMFLFHTNVFGKLCMNISLTLHLENKIFFVYIIVWLLLFIARSLPYVRCVSRNVIFCSSIKMLLCTSGWWTDALVFCSIIKNTKLIHGSAVDFDLKLLVVYNCN